MLQQSRSTTPALVALGCALSGLAALALASTDRLIGQGVPAGLAAASEMRGSWPIAGSEAFWLSSHAPSTREASPAGLTRPVSLGDKVTIASAHGAERVLQVVDMRAVRGPLLEARETVPSPGFVLVTLRDLASGAAGATVRLLIEADDRHPPTPSQEKVL